MEKEFIHGKMVENMKVYKMEDKEEGERSMRKEKKRGRRKRWRKKRKRRDLYINFLLGEYRYDKKHGFGTYTWADGRKYEGNWAYGKQHGKGKYILPDGGVKAGIWEEGKRSRWVEDEETDK